LPISARIALHYLKLENESFNSQGEFPNMDAKEAGM